MSSSPGVYVDGTGSFTITISAGSMTVAGTTPAPWSATVPLDAGALPATRVKLVAPEVGTLAQSFVIDNPNVSL